MLSQSSGNQIIYDENGNLQTYNGWTYTYDAQNRLTAADNYATTPGVHVHYYYDGLNRRIAASDSSGNVTINAWDGWNLIEERTSGNGLIYSYIDGAGIDEKVRRTGGSTTLWYYQDGRGNTTHLADDTGTLRERYTYDLAGRPFFFDSTSQPLNSSTFNNRFLFQGRDYSSDLGLYDYRNRVYFPGWGRFLQTDPIGFAGRDANIYRYCGNDAQNRVDPSGLGGTVDVDGDTVKINIPFVFLDAWHNVSSLGPQIVDDINRYLSGSFGNSGEYHFETNAHITGPSLSSNYITVDPKVGISRTAIGGSYGTWYLGELFPGVSGAYIAAHETLHLLGLIDLYVPGAGGIGFKPGPDGKPIPQEGIDPNNFMVGRGGTSLYNWQVQAIINNNAPGPLARWWQSVVNAMKQDSGRLGAGNAGAYYNGTIYASTSQAAAVMAWDRMYGTYGGGRLVGWPNYKQH